MAITANRKLDGILRRAPKRGHAAAQRRDAADRAGQALAPLRRILCAIDFSDSSRNAVEWATSLARASGADITALCVIPSLSGAAGRAGADGPSSDPDPGVRTAISEDLSELLRKPFAAGVTVWPCLRTGDPSTAILAEVRRIHADLIVMSTHGRSGVNRWLMGSVTDQILRQAPCPVLTVSPAAPAPVGAGAVGRILCALDLDEGSECTFGRALSLGRALGADVTVLHVLEGATGTPAPATLAAATRDRLHRMVADHETPGRPVAEIVTPGRARRQILRVAQDLEADVIVLGAHGRAAAGRALLGSTANHVVRHAPVPVLTVRSFDRKEESCAALTS